jgi:hypothetical protein
VPIARGPLRSYVCDHCIDALRMLASANVVSRAEELHMADDMAYDKMLGQPDLPDADNGNHSRRNGWNCDMPSSMPCAGTLAWVWPR